MDNQPSKNPAIRSKTILAFGYHDRQAPRHWNIKRSLEAQGTRVFECHTTKKGLILKFLDLWRQYQKNRDAIDTVLVTFPGHFLMPLAWLITRFPRKKLLFDAFISLYDTNVSDRKRYAPWNPWAWFLFYIDFLSCHLADEVLIDTEAHRQFFICRFWLQPERVRVAYLGTRGDLFFPTKNQKLATNNKYHVLFYGTYIPLQGIEYIIQAAAMLERAHPNIRFTLIGSGQTRPAMEALAKELKVRTITFAGSVPYEELPDRIRSADVCLGIFGTSQKAQRVIPHKVYDAVACGIPIVTADTPAIREKFQDGKEVILCEAGNPASIAEKIMASCARNS